MVRTAWFSWIRFLGECRVIGLQEREREEEGGRQELGDGRAAYALSSSQMDLSYSIDVNYAVDKKRSTVIMRRDDCSYIHQA